jgi:hypothetical protein
MIIQGAPPQINRMPPPMGMPPLLSRVSPPMGGGPYQPPFQASLSLQPPPQ